MVDGLTIVDDFSDLETTSRWTFSFMGRDDALVLDSNGVRNSIQREAIERMARELQKELRRSGLDH
jgi:hypothetical protein